MSPRARLLAGAAAGIVAAVIVIAAANATWRTVEPRQVVVPVEGSDVVLDRPRALTGTQQDASLSLFALIGGSASVLVLLLEPKVRLVAAGFAGACGLMIAANAGITRSRVVVPAEWVAEASRLTFGPPTAAPAIVMAGGFAMTAAAAWLLLGARDAPKFSMPEGPPESAERDEGDWE